MAGVVAMRHDRRTPKTPDRSLMRARGLLRSCPSRSPTPPHPPRAFACAQKPARCLSSTSPTRAADTLDACLHVARLPRFCRLRAPLPAPMLWPMPKAHCARRRPLSACAPPPACFVAFARCHSAER